MGIFDAFKKKASETPPTDLEERVRKLESLVRMLGDDFQDLHDRFVSFQGRTHKRAAVAAPVEDPIELINRRIREARQREFGLNGIHQE